jgi:hydroxymethylpyrimidine/phosphomethylpyrimidine kinase
MSKPPVVWTIAGFDPSSGAGITADLKTMAALGCYGAACITALTVQNTMGVRRVEPVSTQIVQETLQALLEDLPPAAIKIGMLATAETVSVVADFLAAFPRPGCLIVIDPVLRSSSGTNLLDAEGVRLLRERLLPLASVVTPNRAEAAVLTGLSVEDPEAMARALCQLGSAASVVTGGDSNVSNQDALRDAPDLGYSEDILAYSVRGMEFVETLSAPRIRSNSTHGTGCAFSTAIACALAHGQNVANAVTAAKAFVRLAIQHAPGLGKGKGPMGLENIPKD